MGAASAACRALLSRPRASGGGGGGSPGEGPPGLKDEDALQVLEAAAEAVGEGPWVAAPLTGWVQEQQEGKEAAS